MKIDNFALTMHQACPAKYHLRMIEDWTAKERSAALGFGGAIHEGLAEWYRTGNLELAGLAINEGWPSSHPTDDFRSLGKCIEVMTQYAHNYPTEPFQIVGRGTPDPLIEVSFTLDTGLYLPCWDCGPEFSVGSGQVADDDAVVTSPACANCLKPFEPIQYGGIFDGLIEFGPHVYVLEHKSTSVLGGRYFLQFKPNNQITGYVWAAGKLSNKKVGGAYINAIGVYKSGTTRFERHITTRAPVEIDRWLQDVYYTCCEIQFHKRAGHWPQRTNSCTMYGTCEYHDVHALPDPGDQLTLLEQQFRQHRWDYEERE